MKLLVTYEMEIDERDIEKLLEEREDIDEEEAIEKLIVAKGLPITEEMYIAK